MNSVSLSGGALALFLAITGTAKANLITNGSFEETVPNFVDNTGQDTDSVPGGSGNIPNWVVTSGHNVSWIGPTNPFGLTASDGSYFLDLTDYHDGAPYGGVMTTVGTVAGQTYKVSFDLGSAFSNDGVTVSSLTNSQTFTSNNNGAQSNLWEHEVFTFIASGNAEQLTFQGASGNQYIGLDNVVVTAASGVPELSTWAMMLLGFAGLGFAGYRSSRKTGAAAV